MQGMTNSISTIEFLQYNYYTEKQFQTFGAEGGTVGGDERREENKTNKLWRKWATDAMQVGLGMRGNFYPNPVGRELIKHPVAIQGQS